MASRSDAGKRVVESRFNFIKLCIAEHWKRAVEVQRFQGPDVQPEILADGVQEPLKGQDWHPESRAAEGCAAGGRFPSEQRGAVHIDTEVHAQGRHS